MLKKIFFFILLVGSINSFALNPSESRNPHKDVTVDYLYASCGAVGETKGGDIPYFDCESYVYGVLDAYWTVKTFIPIEKRACFPRDIPPWKALEEVKPLLLTQDLSIGNKIAGGAIIEALKIKYPCKHAAN